ncbi:diguanylate cyclase [Erythrobacter sp.]|uniref:GGDEF domain-containing protein n=1 Tax=Erythrobacter sp. TaxID=1042 RepID=UPI001B2EF199|nr:diguanylate cyclase [Erythrobacter sp.]MBO6526234.1 diguanylate cyclase [Erythrobacter sp.]MBO6530487.1 diguanylate cyclase [Erythrobacter sp.]
MSLGRTIVGLLGPDIPAHLREDFTMLTAHHMRGQARLLFAGFILSLPMAVYGASPGAGPLVAYGLPLVIFALCTLGLVVLHDPARYEESNEDARKAIGLVWQLCLATATIGSIWCIASWASAPVETRIYYPAIMSLGALTLGYCLTAARGVGLSVLLVTLGPAAVVLASTGEPMNLVLGISMVLAIGFQVTMMKRHQSLLLNLVEERYNSARLARRDPLTGLSNRRALMERFEDLAARERRVRLMVVDIDRFKAINDRYGHDVGDEVLRAFAQLVQIHARGGICAARLGGEEFALLAPVEALDSAIALQLLVEIRGAYMPHGEPITASIGVAEGDIAGAADWTALYGRADRALYRAKNEGRNRVMASGETQQPPEQCGELEAMRA